MDRKLNILIVDDDEGDRRQIRRALKKAEALCECTETRDMNEAMAACQAHAFDCALVDYQLPGADGLAAISTLHDLYPFMAIIMSTGQGDEMIATDAMKRGACDYLPKANMAAPSIWQSIENAVGRVDLERQLAQQRAEIEMFSRQLAMIFDAVGVGDWSWDVAKDEITAHPTVWAQYGCPGRRGTAPAAWFRSHQHPTDSELAWAAIDTALKTRQPFQVEFRVVWPDDSIHWLASHGFVVVDQNNNPVQIQGLCMDITKHKIAQLRLEESERQLRQQANAMPQIVWTSGPSGEVESFNDRWYEYTGFSVEHTLKSGWQSAAHPDDLDLCAGISQREFIRGLGFELECRLLRAFDKSYRWHLGRFVPFRDERGAIIRWFGTFTDIHEQKLAKERLEAEIAKRTAALRQLQARDEELEHSLSEQTTLVKEVHHRVKNNLQVISSLLRMQGDLLKDPAAAEALRESQHRVSSMALIHEQLYGDREVGQVDFAQFAYTLVSALFHSYGASSRHVTSKLNVAPVLLKADQAIPCGLILNELVTNALKYAYPDDARGEIIVDLKETRSGAVHLTVCDHGVGLKEGTDFENPASLGLTLVNTLTDQLGGTLNVKSKAGTSFTIVFQKEARSAVAKVGQGS